MRFEARVDDLGRRLHSSCTYQIDSLPLPAQWWTLGVFDSDGRLIPNAAERHGFNSATVARDGAGRFRIVLSRDASPGNWVPTRAAGRMVVLLEVHEPDTNTDTDEGSALQPPTITRVAC